MVANEQAPGKQRSFACSMHPFNAPIEARGYLADKLEKLNATFM
jgi:hypothetical protein